MELIDFQESTIWRTKFVEMNLRIQKLMFDSFNNQNELRLENIILTEWNSLPDEFLGMKRLARSILTFFGSTYSCEQLFSHMNFIKSCTRNRLGEEISAACVKLKSSDYEPDTKTLAENMQNQRSH
ncbi:Protein FAM200A [Dictyocoela muelleri]|nr:Protein FAM200A [Dictyocoela muelleri]